MNYINSAKVKNLILSETNQKFTVLSIDFSLGTHVNLNTAATSKSIDIYDLTDEDLKTLFVAISIELGRRISQEAPVL